MVKYKYSTNELSGSRRKAHTQSLHRTVATFVAVLCVCMNAYIERNAFLNCINVKKIKIRICQ